MKTIADCFVTLHSNMTNSFLDLKSTIDKALSTKVDGLRDVLVHFGLDHRNQESINIPELLTSLAKHDQLLSRQIQMEEIRLYLDLRCSTCRFMIYLKAPNAAGMPMPPKEEKRDASARSLISVSGDNF